MDKYKELGEMEELECFYDKCEDCPYWSQGECRYNGEEMGD